MLSNRTFITMFISYMEDYNIRISKEVFEKHEQFQLQAGPQFHGYTGRIRASGFDPRDLRHPLRPTAIAPRVASQQISACRTARRLAVCLRYLLRSPDSGAPLSVFRRASDLEHIFQFGARRRRLPARDSGAALVWIVDQSVFGHGLSAPRNAAAADRRQIAGIRRQRGLVGPAFARRDLVLGDPAAARLEPALARERGEGLDVRAAGLSGFAWRNWAILLVDLDEFDFPIHFHPVDSRHPSKLSSG